MYSLAESSSNYGQRMAGMLDDDDHGAVIGAITCLLHYADSLGLDPIALSRMAEMHFIAERGEGGEG